MAYIIQEQDEKLRNIIEDLEKKDSIFDQMGLSMIDKF